MTPYTVPNLTGIVAAAGGQTYSVVLQSATSGPGPVLVDGFDTGLSAWTGGGAFRLDSTLAPPGGAAPSLRAALTDRRASAWRVLPQSLDRGCASVEVRLESVTTGVGLLRLRSSTGVGVAEVAVARNRTLRLRSELTGTVVGMSQKVPLNQWHRVGVCVVNDAGNGDELAVTYDGVELGVAAATAAPVGQIQIGSARRATAVFNLDDVEVTE